MRTSPLLFLNFRANSTENRMPVILLTAINARFSHTSLGIRCLYANLRELRPKAAIKEFTIQESAQDIATTLLAESPRIVAIGVYIWNRTLVESVVCELQDRAPHLEIILGGPEISYDTNSTLSKDASCVVVGEGEAVIRELCQKALDGCVLDKVVVAPSLPLSAIELPYSDYSDSDLANRVLYIETSRGCPYQCEYCISALDDNVRYISLDRLLPVIATLLERGATRFKFVDRSFNVNPRHGCELLGFFLKHWKQGMQLHLEMTPEHIPPQLREYILKFPPGALHIEAGVQTFNETVAARVHRDLDIPAVEEGLRFLIEDAKADVHADLIAGLPGEAPESFESGVDRLIGLSPSELQIGILKRLHGAPIERHIESHAMQFRKTPPYDIISTRDMDEAYIDGIQRFAKHWERIVNRQLFPTAAPYIWKHQPSAFAAFDAFSRSIESTLGRHSFGLVELARELLTFLVHQRDIPASNVRRMLREDYLANGRRISLPAFLRD
jgi:radical SAM superfamily enzyme YgiQ (UPF0313 family)